MKDLLILTAHLLSTIAKLPGPGGARAIVADSLLMKQQLLIINRSRRRSPKLTALDRFLFTFLSASPYSKSGRDCPSLKAIDISPIAQTA